MDSLATTYQCGRRYPDGSYDLVPSIRVMVTPYGTVRIHPDTEKALDAELPGWSGKMDKRTKMWRRVRQLELDIYAICQSEWIHGGELEEF